MNASDDVLPSRPRDEASGTSTASEGPPDLLLCLAQSQKQHAARGGSAPKMIAWFIATAVAAALVTALFFWFARRDFVGVAAEPKDARVNASPVDETAVAEPARAKSEIASDNLIAASRHPTTPGTVIQIGAFGNRAQAERAWKAMSSRFPSVAAMSKLIVPFPGGFRLRAEAESTTEAKEACQTLKAAGENCFLAH